MPGKRPARYSDGSHMITIRADDEDDAMYERVRVARDEATLSAAVRRVMREEDARIQRRARKRDAE